MPLKTRATLIGIFILTAYGVLTGFITNNKFIVMATDIFSGISVILIAALAYPLFIKSSKNVSLAYILLKYAEGILMVAGGIVFLFSALQQYRDIIYNGIHLYIFIISAFVFYYLLYTTRLVPRFISIWGVVAMFALTVKTVLGFFNIEHQIIETLLILIITNEVFLAIWLMVKGFNEDVSLNRKMQQQD